MNEKEQQKQQNNMMKTTVGVTVGKIVEASTTKDVDQSLIEVKEELNEFFAKEEKNKEKNLIDGMTPKQHRIWEVNQKKRLDLMEIETGTLKEVNGKILIKIWQEMIILIIITLIFQKRVLELTPLCNERQIEIALPSIWHHAGVLKCTQGVKRASCIVSHKRIEPKLFVQ